jgi:septum formation protein
MLRTKLILASKSPRRAEILRAVGWQFETIAANIDETRERDEDAVSYVKRLAKTKAEKIRAHVVNGTVLGADTTVVVNGEILEQPHDADDARRMLYLLNNKWHEVLTGVALISDGNGNDSVLVDYELTRVRFGEMSDAEIDWYISTGEPFGKAGAYGIQGHAALFIEEVQGDYFNIVGLPIRLVYELLNKAKITSRE